MKTILVARKCLLESWREPHLLALTLLFPLFMMLITVVGYGSTYKLATHPVLVMGTNPRAEALIEQLRAERYPDGRPTFDLQPATALAAAETALKAQTATALLIMGSDDAGGLTVTVRGDATSMRFITASTILGKVITPYLDRAAGMPEALHIIEEPITITAPQTEFDTYAPGMMIFAVLLLTPHTATLIAREIRWGTLRRLRITPLSAGELLGGISLAEMIVAVGQVVIMFATALVLGFHNHGSLLIALGVGLLLSFSAVGFGLIVACFSSNDSDALNIGATVSMLQVFLSGMFFVLPPFTLFAVAGHEIGVFDFLPATHGVLALQQVLIGGAGLGVIGFRLVVMTAVSMLYSVIGVVIFGRRQMRQRA
jgi:ABC-2 type transport system permease protein